MKQFKCTAKLGANVMRVDFIQAADKTTAKADFTAQTADYLNQEHEKGLLPGVILLDFGATPKKDKTYIEMELEEITKADYNKNVAPDDQI